MTLPTGQESSFSYLGEVQLINGGSPVSSSNKLPVTAGIDQTAPGTTDSVSVKTGGYTATQTFTPAAAAYSAGTLMGVAKLMSWVDKDGVAIPANSLIRVLTAIVKIDITAVPSGQTSYSLANFSATPPSAQADQAAYTLASADLPSYLGKFTLGTPIDEGSALYIKTQYVDFDIRLVGTGHYAELITDGAHTAAAVARTVMLHGVVL